MFFFFVSTVMAILPVYTTSKLHAARINLRQTPELNTWAWGIVQLRKRAWFLTGTGAVCKIFRGRASVPDLTNPPS